MKQRLAVHRLGSGRAVADSLGEDCEIVSFRGIFSGVNAVDRIRSVDCLRQQGAPLELRWGSKVLSVIIQQFELDYSSDLWVPYQLCCYVVGSGNLGADALVEIIQSSPVTQVSDILGLLQNCLLQNSGAGPTSDQSIALVDLATPSYDAPSPQSLGLARKLVDTIDSRLSTIRATPHPGDSNPLELSYGENPNLGDTITNSGFRCVLILSRNRIMDIIVRAEDVNQY